MRALCNVARGDRHSKHTEPPRPSSHEIDVPAKSGRLATVDRFACFDGLVLRQRARAFGAEENGEKATGSCQGCLDSLKHRCVLADGSLRKSTRTLVVSYCITASASANRLQIDIDMKASPDILVRRLSFEYYYCTERAGTES